MYIISAIETCVKRAANAFIGHALHLNYLT